MDALLQAGIVPVVSAGNTGPSSLTIASPGSSMSALTVGGITSAANDRILAELIFGPGTGGLYHPIPEPKLPGSVPEDRMPMDGLIRM